MEAGVVGNESDGVRWVAAWTGDGWTGLDGLTDDTATVGVTGDGYNYVPDGWTGVTGVGG